MVTVDFDDISLENYGQLIIVMFISECAIGGLQESGKFIRSGDTF